MVKVDCSFCGDKKVCLGTYKLPVCKDCFKKEFNSNYDKYWNYVGDLP